MKIFGYIWANNAGPLADPAARRVLTFAKQKKLPEPRLQFEDEKEAFTPFAERTQGSAVLSLLRRGDIIIVPDESLLFRTADQGRDLFQLFTSRGIRAFSAETKLDLAEPRSISRILSVLQMLAHYEREAHFQKRRVAIKRLKASGRYLGGNVPIGMMEGDNGSLIPDPNFKKTLRKILKLRAEKMSFRKISDELKKQGVNISHSSIAFIIEKAHAEYKEK